MVRVIVPERNGASLGSGTLIDVQGKRGLVITNWHVVKSSRHNNTFVVFPNGFRSPAKILKTDKRWDLAALSIVRPKVRPIRLAERLPRQGESLTIAGYGSGSFRAARGKCSGFLSPDPGRPPEMLEMTAVARQGDSGGPMLNDRGELAGVLFGAKPGGFSLFGSRQGFTAGSHVGRLRRFLQGTWQLNAPAQDLVAQQPVRIDTRAAGGLPTVVRRKPAGRISGMVRESLVTKRDRERQDSLPTASMKRSEPVAKNGQQRQSQWSHERTVQSAPTITSDNRPSRPLTTRSETRPTPRFQRVPQQQDFAARPQTKQIPDPEEAATSDIQLQDLLGNSLAEQLKTILAVIGGVAIMVLCVKKRG